MQQTYRIHAVIAIALLLCSPLRALAGAPFMTDDPEPVEFHHTEVYLSSDYDKGPDGTRQIQGPTFEINHSPIENLQLHLAIPMMNVLPGDNRAGQHGLGDAEIGAKYRFINDTGHAFEAAIVPTLELPTGSASRGLGNGRAWTVLPVWLQKSWGKWTTYGGGGRAFNDAPGMRSYNFAGWLLERQVSEHLLLGSEVYALGATTTTGQHTTAFNIGGVYDGIDACGHCSLLLRIGHSIAGESHLNAYLALYWKWGPAADQTKK